MLHSAKYLIHAEIRTSGVVERSDVVGAIFGQTEGLLGDELDLRGLQETSKIGRIDVSIDSEDGRSFGTITIASGLDRVRTAVLAAALETIERVGPCRADCTVTHIEDARAAKRQELVDRATDLLADLEESTMTSENLVEAVRQEARVEDITEYEGVPAGPRVADSDAIIVVEGRADVSRLLRFGIKNAIAVEGTDVPEAVARLTTERTTTVLLDGDRGGDLILQELAQVGNVDYVAFAPAGESVEDLDRSAIMSALRKKVPYEQALEADSPREAFAPSAPVTGTESDAAGTDGPSTRVEAVEDVVRDAGSDARPLSESEAAAGDGEPDATDSTPADERASGTAGPTTADGGATTEDPAGPDDAVSPVDPATGEAAAGTPAEGAGEAEQPDDQDASGETGVEDSEPPRTLGEHVEAVIGAGGGQVRLLSESFEVIGEGDADDAFAVLEESAEVPHSVVLDGTVTQRLLDLAAQRGVGQVIGAESGEFVKKPTAVRVLTGEDLELAS